MLSLAPLPPLLCPLHSPPGREKGFCCSLKSPFLCVRVCVYPCVCVCVCVCTLVGNPACPKDQGSQVEELSFGSNFPSRTRQRPPHSLPHLGLLCPQGAVCPAMLFIHHPNNITHYETHFYKFLSRMLFL